jgi:hypothetical protein
MATIRIPRSLDPEYMDAFIANYRAVAKNMLALRHASIESELTAAKAEMLDLGWRGIHDDLVRFNYIVTETLMELGIVAPAEVDSSMLTPFRVSHCREWSRNAPHVGYIPKRRPGEIMPMRPPPRPTRLPITIPPQPPMLRAVVTLPTARRILPLTPMPTRPPPELTAMPAAIPEQLPMPRVVVTAPTALTILPLQVLPSTAFTEQAATEQYTGP